ncbi:MAG: hypothetical protein BWK80_26500 [Desulfobacteraceae bacterium IS3]|nr:MAG: hypothetical protein BWK80_26500 [Desulfobacteraceae bacterium IS3]
MKIRIFMLAVLFSLSASGVFAGWEFVENTKGDDAQTDTQTSCIQDNKMKFVTPDHIMLVDVDKNTVTFADPKRKAYWTGTPEEFAAQAQKNMENMDRMIEKQLSQLPANQREKVRQSLVQEMSRRFQSSPSKIEVKAAKQSDKIAGHSVEKYEVMMNGQLRQELWIAEDVKVNKDLDIKKYGNMMKSFQSPFGRNDQDAALSSPEVMEVISKGWPLRKVDYDEDGYPEREEVVKVENKSLPDTVFALPAGYRQMPMSELFGTTP